MAEPRSLTLCLDECLGSSLPDVLRRLRAPAPNIHGLRELELSGVSDAVMLRMLRERDVDAVVTGDSRILAASIRRDVWRSASTSLFVLDGRWGNLSLFNRARGLLWWWPSIVDQAMAGPQGAAWQVPMDFRSTIMRRLFPDPGSP